MLRRDFMKMFGLLTAGAATGRPNFDKLSDRAVGSEIPTPTPIPGVDEPIEVDLNYEYKRSDATFRLDFGEDSLTIACSDGNLTWTEHSGYEFVRDYGCLDAVRWYPQPIDFHMTAALSWVSDESMIKKIQKADEFDLTYITQEGEYTLTHCRWDQMSFDLSQGYLELSGRAYPQEG